MIPMIFVETNDVNYADIMIGFYFGYHGDDSPFDGLFGMHAYSFPPEIGLLHLDGDELWVVDPDKLKFAFSTDLESMAIHEIGHVLGLGHSRIKSAVMYPTTPPNKRIVDLTKDDVNGLQQLYEVNPNFKPGPNWESSSLEYSRGDKEFWLEHAFGDDSSLFFID
ncbi:OLC1v1009525C1 [Oldenlandia corymbosa var. corymbosa]|uniref:OLC1v1009525C1 n=1 Tax=Oldenlandia corymbosa var. corymbosa TaxID=529605 RepID=A0AAV1DSG6_OLDCO|nr:OLC1v1009525C1 [Oldenlandia corymbosa var. corymbosa]